MRDLLAILRYSIDDEEDLSQQLQPFVLSFIIETREKLPKNGRFGVREGEGEEYQIRQEKDARHRSYIIEDKKNFPHCYKLVRRNF